jgi:hypothetical protein
MNAKKLYERLVGKLMEHWMKLYPAQEWVEPEEAAERIVNELLELRIQVRQLRTDAGMFDGGLEE